MYSRGEDDIASAVVRILKEVIKENPDTLSVKIVDGNFRRLKCFVGGNFVTSPNFCHFPPTKMFKRKFTLLFPFHTWNMIFLLLVENVFPILLGNSVNLKYK